MKARRLDAEAWILVFETGEEVVGTLKEFAGREGITGARFQAIGAFSRATLGFFDLKKKDYLPIPIDEQVEVVSLTGNIARYRDHPRVHAHVAVSQADGTTRGGHLIEAYVRPTLELMLLLLPAGLERRKDPETGLALLEV